MATSKLRVRSETGRTGDEPSPELRNYRLHERIGQEELATVYRATHQTLDRPVRLHILRRTDWVSASRFQLAARLAARLSHPNLLPVIDAGHDDRYGDYLVTPQYDALTLADMVAVGPIEPLLVLRIAGQLAAVLDYLHAEHVIHRDVQPHNILVTPQGLVYLTNLSLAASPDTPDLSSVDEADYLTPYSAPEQRLDQSDSAPALDIYSLGAICYQLFSGEVPPPPGSALPSLAGRDPALIAIDPVLQRTLAPQPSLRYTSATATATALRQALRPQLDQASEDMEESRWETSAEWLENPLETALGDTLAEEFKDYLARSRKRADETHRRDAIRRLLNRWSRAGFFRRPAAGQLVQPEQIVSYNVYFYELQTLFERRSPEQRRERPQKADERSSVLPLPAIWDVAVPEMGPFNEVKPRDLQIPNSIRVFTCPECSGAATIVCKMCNGKATIEKKHKVRNPDNTTTEEPITEECATCRGYGKQRCIKCAGTGNLVEEHYFKWSRRARLWQNTDDLEGLPAPLVERCAEQVYHASINVYEGRWHSIAPLSELLRAAIADVGADTRLIAAELTIRGTPVTEMDYMLNDQRHHLNLIGFQHELGSDWSLYNAERMGLVALGVIFLIATIILVVLFVF